MPGIFRSFKFIFPFIICIICVLFVAVFAETIGDMDIESLILISPPNEDKLYYSPLISGDSILFYANSIDESNNVSRRTDLFDYSISTGNLTLIGKGKIGIQTWDSARIGGKWIVYTRHNNSISKNSPAGTDIFSFNLDSGKEELLGTSFGTNPDVSVDGDIVVWETGTKETVWFGLTNTREYFVIYNLSKHSKANFIPSLPDNPGKPVLYKDLLVYEGTSYDLRNKITGKSIFNNNIFCYNISSGKEKQVSFSGHAYFPSESGPNKVWEDTRNGNPDIYLYNLSGSKEQPVCTNSADQRNPKISGDWVVWEDKRRQPAQPKVNACPSGEYCPVETQVPQVSDIYLYNLTKKIESCISVPIGNPSQITGQNTDSDVSDHRVVWARYGAVYLYPSTK